MKKLVLKTALLGLIVLGINQAVIRLLPFGWGEAAVLEKVRFFEENRDDYNTLFIGSSRTYRHLSPELFDRSVSRDLGIRSFNLGAPSYFFPKTAILFREIMEEKPPRLRYVVFELSKAADRPGERNLHTKELKYWYDLESTLLLMRTILESDEEPGEKIRYGSIHLMTLVEKLLNVGHGVEIIRFVTEEKSSGLVLGPRVDGFCSKDTEWAETTGREGAVFRPNPARIARRTAESREGFSRGRLAAGKGSPALLEEYREIIELAQQSGVKLFFVLPPKVGGAYEIAVPVFDSLPDSITIDLGDPSLRPELYELRHSFDRGHLNHAGAMVFTRLLAREFERLVREGDE